MSISVKAFYAGEPSASQRFGADRGNGRRHRGVDRAHGHGTPVPALLGGRVIGKLAPASGHGFGYQVTIESTYNGVREIISYAHGSAASPLSVGAVVRAGQTVINEGNTGATVGSCVHIERKRGGVYVDPMPLIRAVRSGTAPAPAGSVGRNLTKRPVKDIQRVVGAKQDNRYGPDTTAKVKVWQKAHGLTPDGIWGQKSDAKGFPPKPKPAPKPTLRTGSTGPAVKILQRALKIKDDGIFGPVTRLAVRAFQRRSGLKDDGIVGPQTWARLGV